LLRWREFARSERECSGWSPREMSMHVRDTAVTEEHGPIPVALVLPLPLTAIGVSRPRLGLDLVTLLVDRRYAPSRTRAI
jgi:hypothetical protein